MFDIKWIRDNPTAFDAGLKARNITDPKMMSAHLMELDEARRNNLKTLQDAQARRNAASKEIGKAKAAKDNATATKLMAEVASLKDLLAKGEDQERADEAALQKALEVIPNLPLDEVPKGKDEHDNKEVRRVGEPTKLAFAPKQHFELGEALGMMDFETAAKVSGARFVFLKGPLARLERAIAQFMLNLHTGDANGQLGGYTEVNPPLLVKDHAAYGTGNLPKFAGDLFTALSTEIPISNEFENAFSKLTGFLGQIAEIADGMASVDDKQIHVFHAARSLYNQDIRPNLTGPKADDFSRLLEGVLDDAIEAVKDRGSLTIQRDTLMQKRLVLYQALASRLYLVPTAEIPLTNMVRESVLAETDLPMRLTACTPCFRSEAGSAGRDTRGMIRQHQFTKVELVSITTPSSALAEHERMTACAEEVLKQLKLPFRTVLLCTGDMGFASRKTYDIEVWLPGQDAYREISSCSVCGDFQARRMSARYRPAGKTAAGKEHDIAYVHTLNGSGLAVGRTLVAIMENYQQADGSILIPDALLPYMGGKTKIERAG
jgi:seryl-tRNA synthetase